MKGSEKRREEEKEVPFPLSHGKKERVGLARRERESE